MNQPSSKTSRELFSIWKFRQRVSNIVSKVHFSKNWFKLELQWTWTYILSQLKYYHTGRNEMNSFCVISGLVIGLFDFRRTKTKRKLCWLAHWSLKGNSFCCSSCVHQKDEYKYLSFCVSVAFSVQSEHNPLSLVTLCSSEWRVTGKEKESPTPWNGVNAHGQ